ncbi:hypothetical protein DM806_16910 [Sphingobium lactosutens]|nr:hypothetical protein [Sphingobium lactosutens]
MRFSPALAAASSLMVLLASCVGPPSQPPAPTRPTPTPRPVTPAPAPPPAATPAPPAANWEDRALTPGNWSYRQDTGGSAALFGTSAQPLFTLRCDRANRRITALRAGAGQGAMVIRTSYGAVSWPATVDAGTQTVAARSATDSVLDQIAYSRGKIGVEVPGLASLVLPAWAETARVVEDCRA